MNGRDADGELGLARAFGSKLSARRAFDGDNVSASDPVGRWRMSALLNSLTERELGLVRGAAGEEVALLELHTRVRRARGALKAERLAEARRDVRASGARPRAPRPSPLDPQLVDRRPDRPGLPNRHASTRAAGAARRDSR